MGDGNRTGRYVDGLKGGSLGRMAHIHDKPDPIHFCNDGPPHAGDAGILGFIATGGQQ